MKLHTEKLIRNGKAIARLSYDINVNQWSLGQPSVFFHVEGHTEYPVSGYVDINEGLANDLCKAFNQKHFGQSIPVRFVCSQTTITDTYLATPQSHELPVIPDWRDTLGFTLPSNESFHKDYDHE